MVLGPMIFIHEFGHFIVAKMLKIRVEVFSLGFGPRLLGFRWGDTDYRLSLIPLGGYVKMKGETLEEELEFTGDEFLARPKWHRFLVLVAGPLMNIITAIAIPATMAMFLFRVPEYLTKPADVGSVSQASAAAQAGIKPGDRIVKFDNKDNPTWHDVEIKSEINPGTALSLVIDRNGQQISATMTPKVRYVGREKVGLSGLLPKTKEEPVEVGQVMAGSPADQAGLKMGDTITKLNGEKVENFYWLRDSLQNFDGQEIAMTVDRAGKPVDLKMKPRVESDGAVRVGFAPKNVTPEPTITTRKPLFEAIQLSIQKNIEVIVLTKEALGQIATGQRKAQDALAGPISIAAISSEAYQRGGFESLLGLMALLSLNLGIFNLFPIPVLDGGHIFMLILEGLLGLAGYKLSLALKEKMLQFGFVVLVLLMGFVIINDISKFFIQKEPRDLPAATQPAPANQPPANSTPANPAPTTAPATPATPATPVAPATPVTPAPANPGK
jgi:regulator of sigma E protease